MLKAVRYQIKHGAKNIKICATAGVLSFEDGVGLVAERGDAMQAAAERLGADFVHLPVTRENRVEQEHRQLELLQQYRIDLIVLKQIGDILKFSSFGDLLDHFAFDDLIL